MHLFPRSDAARRPWVIRTFSQQVEPPVVLTDLKNTGAFVCGNWISSTAKLVDGGNLEQALDYFNEPQGHPSNVYIDRHTLLGVLKACGKQKYIACGQRSHGVLIKYGHAIDCLTGRALVYMYGKCGLLMEAQYVLDKVPSRNVSLWTCLIGAYADHGHARKALDCMKRMKLDGLLPNSVSFICILKACGDIRASHECLRIHCEIVKLGFEEDVFVGSALVDAYSKSFYLLEAQKVVDVLPYIDSVILTPLLVSYGERGLSEKAFNCWKRILKEEIYLDVVTLKCSVKACGSTRSLEWGREVHIEIVKRGLEINLAVCNTLVDMYAKCGSLTEAEVLFHGLPVKDVVSWNILLHGYCEHDLGYKVYNCLEQMRRLGVPPTTVTFVCCLTTCETLKVGQEMHLEVNKLGIESNKYVVSALVDMYVKFGLFTEALKGLDELTDRNIVSWTALIGGYAEHSLGEEAMHFFSKMISKGIPVDVVTFYCSLKVCGDKSALSRGQELHAFIVSEGFERDPYIGSMLVEMYATCGFLRDAEEVFYRLLAPTVASWTSLIVGYAKNGLTVEALNSADTMQLQGLPMNAISYACSLRVCANAGVLNQGLKLYTRLVREGFERDCLIGKALVDFYAKCGLLLEAQNVFDKLPSISSVLWTVLMTGHACRGENLQIFELFRRTEEQGIEADKVTFLSLLTACSHAGLVDEGLYYFAYMYRGYGIAPSMDHLNCIVDVYSRAGQFERLSFLLEKMPFQPDLSTWHIILCMCRKWGDVVLGRHAFESALLLGENPHLASLLMFSICMEADLRGYV
ncbi:hypothetical protein GOP47_0021320 [Adiantum capillus-veneris]|uniref:Pentatricopeptide repeat-containing protein n=1 Tax=Adiantum capillus-veneris TaxID=13818 RepID=A0A9D4UBD7_ADICA|nr:hypothetical protein GOP47_0021320 [Adiantum capillus-veneris]